LKSLGPCLRRGDGTPHVVPAKAEPAPAQAGAPSDFNGSQSTSGSTLISSSPIVTT
jgi:hypothetical protein